MTAIFENHIFDAKNDQDHPFGEEEVFENCQFLHFKLADIKMSGSRFIDCKFIHCDFSNSNWTNCSLRDVRFEDSKLMGICWSDVKSASHLYFERCFLDYSSFAHMDLRQSQWVECEIKTADFTESNLGGARIHHCNLEDSAFHKTNLEKADMTESFNFHIDLRENRLKHATFSVEGGLALLEAVSINLAK